jgi:hypothetical protein
MAENELKATAKPSTKRGRKPKGLGDRIEQFTEAAGIKAVVDWFSDATGVDCGCEARKEKLNRLFPSKNPKCLEQNEYEWLTEFYARYKSSMSSQDQKQIAKIHARIFNHAYHIPCGCNPKLWKQWIEELRSVYSEYDRTAAV